VSLLFARFILQLAKMGSSKRGCHCGCGLGSRIPLRGQVYTMLIVSGFFLIVLVPGIIDYIQVDLSGSFEAKIAFTNINRCMASMYKALVHEDNVLTSYSVWNETADAMDALMENNMTRFYEYLEGQMFDFGAWSDWTCGNLLAWYSLPGEDGSLPKLMWAEYHVTDHETLEMDTLNKAPVPGIFNDTDFIKSNINGNQTSGYLATKEVVLLFSCQVIYDGDMIAPHGTMCRATDIVLSLDGISSGAGACISIYNLASDDVPDDFRAEFESISVGERTDDNKYNGGYTLKALKGKKWEEAELPFRRCGPAEQTKANISKRSLSFLHMANAHRVLIGDDEKKNGLGIILDNARELEPLVAENFNLLDINISAFGLIVFFAFGLITECCVIRKLDTIAEAAYGALVEGEEDEYDDYYSGSKNVHKEKRPKERGKNELITMATLAAQNVEKNGKELGRKKNLLIVEKMHSSLLADQFRLLGLYCDRQHEDDAVPNVKGKKKKSKSASAKVDDSQFYSSSADLATQDITFDRVLNDPFSLEMFKNFCIEDPKTKLPKYPARQSLLFLLSSLFYRSMSDVAIDARVECIKGIVEEFFGVQVSLRSTKGLKNISKGDDDLGISDSARRTLFANAGKCIASRRPTKSLFDESSSAVHDHLEHDIFPQFVKSPEFSLVRISLAQKSVIQKTTDAVEAAAKDSTRTELSLADPEKESQLRGIDNSSGGAVLSHGALKYFSGFQ